MPSASIRLLPLAILSGLAGLALLSPGCNETAGPAPPPIENRISLTPFETCDQLESYIEDAAVQEMRAQFEMMKQGAWGWGGRGGGEFSGAANDAAGGAAKQAAPTDYTTTNNQVKGVDEADFTKNDGTRIFTLAGRKLFAAQSWPPEAMKRASEVLIEGWPSAMFLDEKNRVVVLSSVWLSTFANDAADPCGGVGGDCWGGGNATKLTVVDVSDIEKPVVKDEFYVPGWYNDARRIKSSVRVVMSDWFRWPSKMKWWPEWQDGLWEDKERLARALDQMAVENEALIRAQTLEGWLPSSMRKAEGGQIVKLGYQCSDFYVSNAPVKMGLVTVATLNLDDPGAPPARTSVLAQPGQIYASESNLYVAANHWWWWPQPGQADYTYVHKFDITDPARATYVASGGFLGHIVDQFSLDEHDGYFRVASTLSTRVKDDQNPQNTWGRIETTNQIFVLAERNGGLQAIGQSEEIAKGERIQSSRFQGPKAYVVTFRQVDPLYTFDMSNPASPRRVGELKVPGFSTYIHPLDDTHLLTMGIYLPEPDPQGRTDWRERRMQLSIFDVTNFASPKLAHSYLVGTAYGWSEAAWEHKAFNYFASRKLLAIPFSDYQPVNNGDYWGSFVSELRVFRVDAATGFKSLGAITMKDLYDRNAPDWRWYYSPWIRRSVMASDNDGNEFVYAISDAGIRVANAAALGTPLSTVLFENAVPR